MKSRVLVVEPSERPRSLKIENTESAVRKIVGGDFLVTIYDTEEPALIVYNAEGVSSGLSFNRALRDEKGNIYEILAGTFIICEANFGSLSPRQEMFYRRKFNHPDLFVKSRGVITVL